MNILQKIYQLCHLSGSALKIGSSNFDYAEFIQSIHQILIRLETIFISFFNTILELSKAKINFTQIPVFGN